MKWIEKYTGEKIMEKQMRELLERSFKSNEVIAYIESLEMDNMLLTKENKALTLEGELKCELNQKLEKALDKACEELENLSYVKGLGQVGRNFKEWKEWCLESE